jgi:hypothetical protein
MIVTLKSSLDRVIREPLANVTSDSGDADGDAHAADLPPAARSPQLDAVYERVAEELRSQYTVGYVSGNKRRDGKWRRIVVRTPAREDLRIRHKLGYYAARG